MFKTPKILIFIVLLAVFSTVCAQRTRITTESYIERYKLIAVDEMKRSGIPASITLAQGLIESGSGNSTLAREANNHFGIKCHKWKGPRFIHNDDAKDECFRKYDSPEASYRDHTDFLMQGSRYDFLFEYKSTDYKSWAYGLKKAGYATNPNYPKDLIRTIDNNDLHRFDIGDISRASLFPSRNKGENFTVDIKRRQIFEKNRIKYIIVGKNETIASITKEMDLFSGQLKNYNELPSDYQILEGDLLYIQPKRWRAEVGNDFHIVKENETMHLISQLYGIKLRKLYRKNLMELGVEPEIGQKIWLRQRKPN